MDSEIRASGYVRTTLTLNMKRYIRSESRDDFERSRCSQEFAWALKEEWSKKILSSMNFSVFQNKQKETEKKLDSDVTNTQRAGYVTGLFGSTFLNEYLFPTYFVNKENITFESELMQNFQFKNLFLRAWNKLSITIRPSFTGFFVISFIQQYPTPVNLLSITSDVALLQSSFDIKSAINWLEKLRVTENENSTDYKVKERSVQSFINWLLGSTIGNSNTAIESFYSPLQSKLASEICALFIRDIGFELPISLNSPLKLFIPDLRLSPQYLRAFTTYHIDNVIAPQITMGISRKKVSNPKTLISVSPKDIRNSKILRNGFAGLIEGKVLNSHDATPTAKHYPNHRLDYVDKIFQQDISSWEDELFILTTDSALIFPSKSNLKEHLFTNNLPGSTNQISYIFYWMAIERMLEWLVEIRILSRLLNSFSSELGKSWRNFQNASRTMLDDDIEIDKNKVNQFISNIDQKLDWIGQLTTLVQELGTPQTWSNSEYGIKICQRFLENSDFISLIENTEIILEKLSKDLSEFVNQQREQLKLDQSILQAYDSDVGVSTELQIVIALTLPSFWIAILQIFDYIPQTWKSIIFGAGILITTYTIIAVISFRIKLAREKRKIKKTTVKKRKK